MRHLPFLAAIVSTKTDPVRAWRVLAGGYLTLRYRDENMAGAHRWMGAETIRAALVSVNVDPETHPLLLAVLDALDETCDALDVSVLAAVDDYAQFLDNAGWPELAQYIRADIAPWWPVVAIV